jgi:hypothetical protein
MIEDIVDALYRERDMTDPQRVRRSARVTASARRRVELGQTEPCVAVSGAHHGDVRPDSLEPDDTIDRAALDRCLALQLESEPSEARHRVREVVDDDPHMIHTLDRLVLDDRHAAPRQTSIPRLMTTHDACAERSRLRRCPRSLLVL